MRNLDTTGPHVQADFRLIFFGANGDSYSGRPSLAGGHLSSKANSHRVTQPIEPESSASIQKHDAGFQILSGWKAIANYLGAGVRTVQRYERELRLPIYRPAGKSISRVTAIKHELDRWAKGVKRVPAELDNRAANLRMLANRVGAQFLLVDAEIALTLSSLALRTSSTENRERQSKEALKAYQTITRLRRNLDLSQAEDNKLDAKLERLRSELQQLGML